MYAVLPSIKPFSVVTMGSELSTIEKHKKSSKGIIKSNMLFK